MLNTRKVPVDLIYKNGNQFSFKKCKLIENDKRYAIGN